MKTYEVEIHGIPHTMQLDDAAAKQLGAKEALAPSNKQVTPKNKAATDGRVRNIG